jgi:hypothetical protein
MNTRLLSLLCLVAGCGGNTVSLGSGDDASTGGDAGAEAASENGACIAPFNVCAPGPFVRPVLWRRSDG